MRFCVALMFLSSFGLAMSAPSFQGDLLDGGKISLKEKLKPGRALLVCFWATWCTPCLEELKSVSEKLKVEPNLGLDVLTVNVDTAETFSDVKPTLKLYGFSFPVVVDTKHEIFGKYQSEKTLPYSVLIDFQGNIQATFSGYQETMMSKVKSVISSTRLKKG